MTKYLNWIFPIIFNLDFIKNLDVILNLVIKNWLFIPPFAVRQFHRLTVEAFCLSWYVAYTQRI
jgi:hypothetical protein